MILRSQKTGVVLVLAAASLWATVGISAALVPASPTLTPEFLACARTVVGGTLIVLAGLLLHGARALRIRRSDLMNLCLFALSNAVFQIGLFWSFDLLGVSMTAFLTGCLPPILCAGWQIMRRPGSVDAGMLVVLGVSIAGLGLIASGGETSDNSGSYVRGIAVAVLTAGAFVLMSQSIQALGRAMPPMTATGLGLSLSGGLLLVVALASSPLPYRQVLAELSRPDVIGLALYLGLVPTALAFVLYCRGIALCRSALVGLIASMIRPAVATGLSVWILSEAPSAAETLGCAFLMMAMLILWQNERNQTSRRIGAALARSGAN